MTRDTAKAIERDHELTPDELDAVSGGRKAGGTQNPTLNSDNQFFDVFITGGGGGAGKIIGILVG